MMCEKTLVLNLNKNAYYFGNLEIEGVEIAGVFKDNCDYNKNPLIKFSRKYGLNLAKNFYGAWYKKLKNYTKIIVFDVCCNVDEKLLYNISRKAPAAEKYFYSWNIVKKEDKYFKVRSSADQAGFKCFCYDKGNCKKYNMSFNTIMYDKNIFKTHVNAEYDAFFLGYLKDRKEKLLALYYAMKSAGINARFVITRLRETIDESLPFEYSEKYIGYYDYLDMLSKSKAILDISQNDQDGYSMRVMESIFFNKKLITTNVAVKDADFYDENNILIIELGQTNVDEIKAFFEKDFHPYSEKIREYYSFEEWVNRFK